DEYIVYYNNKRIKLRLNGKSPVQYRTLFFNQ
ncbi:MAG: IS3 family transposase, partial [Muribaculaceae bacterium]|nr:IS3 family transposase [Muribaculaceae bacterium]